MAPLRRDPTRSSNFMVEADGIERASFRECGGIDSTIQVTDHREGTDPQTMQKLPGLVSYSPLTLSWGATTDQELWEWHRKAAEGNIERRNVSIVQLDQTGQELARWNLINAWPSKWTGPTFNATGNEVSIERLELSHEGLTWA